MTILGTDTINYKGETPLKEEITVVEAAGGHKTNPLWTSQISSEDFKKALEDSLASVQLLNPQNNGKYRLSLELQKLKQPIVGFNMTVTAVVNYKLADAETGKVVLEETIETPFTATVSDAFMGVERLKLANEGAARENIKELIAKLYSLEIAPTDVTVE